METNYTGHLGHFFGIGLVLTLIHQEQFCVCGAAGFLWNQITERCGSLAFKVTYNDYQPILF